MADHGLFIGWGAPVHGREAKGLEVFAETVEYFGGLQSDGRIESFEPALLDPHGGDLDGFMLIRGTEEQMQAVQVDPDFRRVATRASLVIQNLGVVRVALGEALGQEMGIYQEAAQDIA
jgi:hypothetical protein